MFLRRLRIDSDAGNIRDITFRKGLNLIVDETTDKRTEKTGNNVGKTTVLRLIKFCFSAKSNGRDIYQDGEQPNENSTKVEQFLKEKNVIITIELVEDLDKDDSKKVTIQRNFNTKGRILRINGRDVRVSEFDMKLKKILFDTEVKKPSTAQIVFRNIRVDESRTIKTLRGLDERTKNIEYEALHLFWLGISTDYVERKKKLLDKQKEEKNLQDRLKVNDDLPLVEQRLVVVSDKIEELERVRDNFKLNENYEKEFEEINKIKLDIGRVSSEISRLEIRKQLIMESKSTLEQEYAEVNTEQIRYLYDRANALIGEVQVSFESTLNFHNELTAKKLEYITQEIPELNTKIESAKHRLVVLREQESKLTKQLQKFGVWEDLRTVTMELNKEYETRGNLLKAVEYWEKSEMSLKNIERELSHINEEVDSKYDEIRNRTTIINNYFRRISKRLYDEEYIIAPKMPKNKQGIKIYSLEIRNNDDNPGRGKKRGEIAAFDLAYIQFADELKLNCLKFLMLDESEAIHDNQLNKISELANEIKCQYILPILRDKVPEEINVDEVAILNLSQDDKLFGIEKTGTTANLFGIETDASRTPQNNNPPAN